MLHNLELPSIEFVKLLVYKIDKLTSHHFIAKSQSRFSRELKANLSLNQCLLQGDFSQNYSMLSQDSTQSSFFSPPPQCTLPTFIAYINLDGKIISHSMCVFSNDMNHNTAAVQYPAQKSEHRFNFLKPPIGGVVGFLFVFL
ncbi:Cc8L18.2-like protein [Daphnia magna]|uniref:Cc8L18.2-like protein n=1 Tax=Daphnia magna TaxID=35525 RepID=A0A164E471_9CRUS|nr:Cc8L18.2-like protein [Daphnia magna]